MAKYCFTNFAKCKVEPPMPNSSTVAVVPNHFNHAFEKCSTRRGHPWVTGILVVRTPLRKELRSFVTNHRPKGGAKTGNERSASNSKLITSFRTFGFMRQVCGFEFTGAQLFDLRWVNLQRAVTTHFLASSSARYPRTCVPCCETCRNLRAR